MRKNVLTLENEYIFPGILEKVPMENNLEKWSPEKGSA